MDWLPLTHRMMEIQESDQLFPLVKRINSQQSVPIVREVTIIEAGEERAAHMDGVHKIECRLYKRSLCDPLSPPFLPLSLKCTLICHRSREHGSFESAQSGNC